MSARYGLRAISSILALLAIPSNLQAQTGDWRAVQNLQNGSRIIVKAKQSYYCAFEGATEDHMVCEVHKRRSLRTTSLTIPRTEVREVRVLPNQAKHAYVGAGIGSGVGAITAAATHKTSRGAYAFFGALVGAGFGALVGALVSVFRRGKIIYSR